ncbi:MAG: DUF2029 domain-containing protein [Candidatus Eremiobacteraeota bacterium]|nr:DUF2029 domain-containing protein [Candidatus Eremiobacteraeota bacterium]
MAYFILIYSYKNVGRFLTAPEYSQAYCVDFRCYYAIASMMKNGNPHIYDSAENITYLKQAEIDKNPAGKITYPPSFYFMMIPLTYIPLPVVVYFWTLSRYLLILLIAIMLSYLVLKDNPDKAKIAIASILFVALIYIFSPTLDDIFYGQVNIHILFLLSLSLLFLEKKMDVAAGIVLGLIFCLKFTSILVILFFLVCRRWKVSLASLGAILAVNLPILILYKPGIYLDYIRKIPENLGLNMGHLNLSFQSKLAYFFEKTGISTMMASKIIISLSILFSIIIVIISFYFLYKNKEKKNYFLEYSLLITATILVSPITWSYHYVLLFIPFAYLARYILFECNTGKLKTTLSILLPALYLFISVTCGMSGDIGYHSLKMILLRSGLHLIALMIIWIMILVVIFQRRERRGRRVSNEFNASDNYAGTVS